MAKSKEATQEPAQKSIADIRSEKIERVTSEIGELLQRENCAIKVEVLISEVRGIQTGWQVLSNE